MSAATATLALGAFYVLIGILGFIPGITNNGLLLGIFAVNALHNIVHLVAGLVLIWGARSASLGMVDRAMAVVFAALVVASFVAPVVEQVPLNPPDTILHLVSAAITGYFGFMNRTALAGTR